MVDRQVLREKAAKLLENSYAVTPGAYENYISKYWAHLFSDEIEIVREQAAKDTNILDFGAKDGRIMIISLGTSLEPLVLATHLVAPQQLFVLYSQPTHLKNFEDALRRTAFTIAPVPIPIPEAAGAAGVFKLLMGKTTTSNPKLRKNLGAFREVLDDRDNRNRIVFDITGAKKTISGGCLLFAAYYELPVYYMDFGDDPNNYDSDLGRPYPGACFYSRQENPIVGFCIKDFERLKENFNQRRFYEVDQLLDKILGKMNSNEGKVYFNDDERKVYSEFKKLNSLYMDWQNGWFGDIAKAASTPGSMMVPNTFISKLTKYPSRESMRWRPSMDFQVSLYDDIDGFASYVTLELANLLRGSPLLKQNCFLRAYRLEEFLLSYMLLKLNNDGKIEREILRKDYNGMVQITDSDHNAIQCVRKAVCRNYSSIEYVFKGYKNAFLTPVGDQQYVKFIQIKRDVIIHRDIKDAVLFFSKYRWIRDSSVHGVGAVPDNLLDSESTLTVLDHLKRLWKCLLKDRNVWFPNAQETLDEIQKLMEIDEWYFDSRVAPLKWEAIEQMITAANSAP